MLATREKTKTVTENLLLRNLEVLGHLHQATAIDVAQLDEQRALAGEGRCDHGYSHRCTRPECILAELQSVVASDPRDRIYALLNLMDCQIADSSSTSAGKTPSGILIDYNLSTSQVFQILTKYIINRDRSLRILAKHTPAKSKDVRLPSWTPDWRAWRWHPSPWAGPIHDANKLAPSAFPRHDYTKYDTLIVHGQVIARFASSPDGRQELRLEPQCDVSKPRFRYAAADLETAADIVPGDIVVHNYRHYNDAPGRQADLEPVLRPRKAGGYYFVRALAALRESDGHKTKHWAVVKSIQESRLEVEEEFIVW